MQNEFSDMERDLLIGRSSLERGVEDDLVSRIGPMRRGRGGFRAALALTATTVVFAALAASGGVSYAVNQAKNAVNGGSTTSTSSEVQYGEGSCVEYVNPHGQNIPPAGQTPPGTNPNSGMNPDGFYQIGGGGSDVWVVDTATGHRFGPYPSGTVIKYTESNGAAPSAKKIGSTNGQAGAVYVHIQGQGDPAIVPVGTDTATVCYVPPKPK